MGAILAENKLHHLYWRATTKIQVNVTVGGTATGFEPVNMFDNNIHTSFMNPTGTQTTIFIDMLGNQRFNGFAVYGHNLTTSMGLKLQYSTDGTSYTLFTDSAVYGADGIIHPDNNNGEAFCCYLKGTSVNARYLKITTSGFTTSTFISNFALGNFVDNVNIAATYTMPSFTPHEVSIKRNNQGNFLSSDTRKIPQKLNIKLNTFQESDLDSVQANITDNAGNLLTEDLSFIEYLGFYLARFPFFVLHDDGGSGTNAEKLADRNKIYFCTIDKSLKQPQFNTPTTLNWNINAIGYIS